MTSLDSIELPLLLAGQLALLALYLRHTPTWIYPVERRLNRQIQDACREWSRATVVALSCKSSQELLLGELKIDSTTPEYLAEVARREAAIAAEGQSPPDPESILVPGQCPGLSPHSLSSIYPLDLDKMKVEGPPKSESDLQQG